MRGVEQFIRHTTNKKVCYEAVKSYSKKFEGGWED